MEDLVEYCIPLPFLDSLANRIFIEPDLDRIFNYRKEKIAQNYGVQFISSLKKKWNLTRYWSQALQDMLVQDWFLCCSNAITESEQQGGTSKSCGATPGLSTQA
jgi:hypothetical protein